MKKIRENHQKSLLFYLRRRIFVKLNLMCKILKKYFIPLSLAVACSAEALVGGTSTKSVVTSRTTSAIKIDGELTEAAWQAAVPVSGFQQSDPEEGAPATERTEVWVLYDDNALYIGAMCYDSDPSGIIGEVSRRDRSTRSDKFSVFIDSYNDHSTAFCFIGSATGVQTDALLSQDGHAYDTQWDAVWDFNAARLPNGWSAEFRIPYSALRFAAQDSESVWGINFRRFIGRKNEIDDWVLITRKEIPAGSVWPVSKFGNLSGLRGIHPQLHIEMLPYLVSNVNYLAQPEPFALRKEFRRSAGMDLKYGITNNFTCDLAVNPDFGQVEVDQAVVNMTVFETFYPEKRPFFLEGSQIFSFGSMFDNQSLQLLYSRRIGRQPSAYDTLSRYGSFDLSSNAAYAEKPEITSILAATKFSGRTSGGLEVGALTAETDEEDAVLEDASGRQSGPIEVEPRASYNAVRLRQTIGENSWIGMMTTGTFKQWGSPALSGGVDWNAQLGENAYCIDGYVAGSQIVPSPGDRQTGSAGRLGMAKLAGEHWLAFTTYDFSLVNFDINDIGFYSQPHEHGGYFNLTYKEDHAEAPVRRYNIVLETDYRWNWDRANTLKYVELEPNLELRNFWTLTLDCYHDLPAYDDYNRGIYTDVYTNLKGLYRRPEGNRYIATVQTDSRDPWYSTLSAGFYENTKDLRKLYSSLQMTLRPNTWMEFDPAITVVRTRNEETWIQYLSTGSPIFTEQGKDLFGSRDMDEYDFSLRGTITLTRSLSVQFFTQVLLAKGHYADYRTLISPTEFEPYDYLDSPIYAMYGNTDFNEKWINANFILRWEYIPGSTFYLVWTQARYGNNGTYDIDLADNFSDAFRLPMDNVLLAKISYWWSM